MGLRSKCWFAYNFSSFCLVQRYASWQFLCFGVVGENRTVCCPRKWFWTKRWNIPFQVGWCKTLGHSARFLKIKKLPHFISHFNTKNTKTLCEFKGFFSSGCFSGWQSCLPLKHSSLCLNVLKSSIKSLCKNTEIPTLPYNSVGLSY